MRVSMKTESSLALVMSYITRISDIMFSIGASKFCVVLIEMQAVLFFFKKMSPVKCRPFFPRLNVLLFAFFNSGDAK